MLDIGDRAYISKLQQRGHYLKFIAFQDGTLRVLFYFIIRFVRILFFAKMPCYENTPKHNVPMGLTSSAFSFSSKQAKRAAAYYYGCRR